MRKVMSLLAMLLLASTIVKGQQRPEPPVSLEMMFGHKKAATLMGMNKQVCGPIRYNNITSVSAAYDIKKAKPELIMLNNFLYQFHSNVGAGVGLQYHFLKGLVPSASLNFNYASPVWVVSVTPYLNFRPDINSENVAMIEYKPQISENLKLYTYALGLYNHNITLGTHDRSFYYFRLGLTKGKFTVGAAANFDYYGAARMSENNFGGFVKIAI